MEMFGPNLENVFKNLERNFSITTVAIIGMELLSLISYVHSKGFVHGDIKPENFVTKFNFDTTIHIIDFGLAKRYNDYKSGLHIPFRKTQNFAGTPMYSSINTHLGIEQSRRDDIESFAYTLLYFLKGSLPWKRIEGNKIEEKYERILEMKLSILNDDFCKDLPKQFIDLLSYAQGMKFEEEPDYNYIKKLLLQLLPEDYYLFGLTFEQTRQVFYIPHNIRMMTNPKL